MFKAPFSFEGRIRRTEFGLSYIIYCVAYGIVLGLATFSKFSFILILPIAWFLLAQGAKRCHDRGNTGWYQIIPLYALWMIFGSGETGSNSYGYDPKNPELEGQLSTGQADILDSDIHV